VIRPAFQPRPKLGDLVKYVSDTCSDPCSLGIGLLMGFDKDGDPIVWFQGDERHDQRDLHGSAFYAKDIEVISEGG
jgi:hypothetical protein